MKINKFGFIKVKAVSPELYLADVQSNVNKSFFEIKKAYEEQVSVVVFPELNLTGYTCDDLFHQQYLLDESKNGLIELLKKTKYLDIIAIVGIPYQMPDGRLYNCAFILHKGNILGGTLKKYLPNYLEFYDQRFFSSGMNKQYDLSIDGQSVLVGNQIYRFSDNNKILFSLGVSICEDDWGPRQNAEDLALNGADLIVNLSASNELVSKADYRKEMLSQLSGRLHCGYVYASSGANESNKDTIFGGHCLIFENGNLLSESERFNLNKTQFAISDIDLEKLAKERRTNTTFCNTKPIENYLIKDYKHSPNTEKLSRTYLKNPFVPSEDEKIMNLRSEEIFSILSTGLARTIKGSGLNKILLGLSGGMDSTLVALIAVRALEKLNLPSKNLIAVSMPGFGTSNRTKNQSRDLANALNISFLEIDIKKSVSQHFQDIKHPENLYDVTFENAQARERTQILFDLANKNNGFMVSGSSLSEIAIGWSTFGGDSISNYNVLGSCPKSLSKYLIKYESFRNENLKNVLLRVLDTKISPELIPGENKEDVHQSSEESVGNYDIIDFCIYHQIKNGFSKDKIKFLINYAYEKDGAKEFTQEYLNKVVDNYFYRFYKNQFKRTMMPQSIKLGVSLSPRSDWRMPDLTSYKVKED